MRQIHPRPDRDRRPAPGKERQGLARRPGLPRRPTVPLRSPRTAAGLRALTSPAGEPPLATLLLNRAAFGPAPGDLEEFMSLGGSDDERLAAWVDRQLDPASIDDSELEARLAASGYTTLDKSLSRLWTEHMLEEEDWEVRMRPVSETELAVFLRAVYTRRQLAEVLAHFWHDHFNVWGWHDDAGPVFTHYDREVIRGHALGNFRAMLEAVAASPAMLVYLDNVFNSADGPNENYARELLELHTLGEENYLGVLPADEVPRNGDGVAVGFVDEDVRELARCLTGWTLDWDTGAFIAPDEEHDQGAKTVLGIAIPAGQGALRDVRQVLDLLAAHPGVAHFVCRKLCRRFVADDPPESLVRRAADVFLAEREAPDQLARVVRTILLSDEFRTSWGGKVKRPFETLAAALRAANPDFLMPVGDPLAQAIVWLQWGTGHLPHNWIPPTGFPDERRAWLGSTSLAMSWRIVNWMVGYRAEDGTRICDPVAATPSRLRTAEELADHWIQRVLARPVAPACRDEIVQFMAQGRLPTLELPWDTDEEIGERLRSMVALIALSPENLWR